MTVLERVQAGLSRLAYELAPKSPPRCSDEQQAGLALYPTAQRGVNATLKRSGRAVSPAGRVIEEQSLNDSQF